MLKTRVMPCLLLRNEALVKTIRFKAPTYVGDPINTVRIFNDKEVDELVVLDITATVASREPNLNLLREIASECFMPLTFGGGIRSVATAEAIFSIGAEKVVINSAAAGRPSFVSEVAREFGSQSIIVSIDAKRGWWGNYKTFTHGGRRSAGRDPVHYARLAEESGAGEILLTSMDRDGTFSGYDVDLIQRVTSAVGIPVIASGGAGKIDDFAVAVTHGASAVAAGSLVVFQGKHRSVLINFPSRAALKGVLP